MDQPDPQRLSDLTTSWTLLQAAHDPGGDTAVRTEARRELIERYLGVVRRYLGGALRLESGREEAVEELVQEFSVKVMAGSLHNASPDQGRFRQFLRKMLVNLVNESRRRKQRREIPVGGVAEEASNRDVGEEAYTTIWREELVRRALQALAEHERQTGEVRYTVLKLMMDHPALAAAELAERLTGLLGRPVDAAWVRKRKHLAREKLRELLRREVRQTLREPTDEAVEEELAEVGLLVYCR